MKEKATIAGGLISVVFTVTFAMYLLNNNVPQSIASWTMWAVLDVFLFVSSIAAGNKKAWLPLGYAVGAILVVCILFSKSGWKWGIVETISATGALSALLLWWKLGPKTAIIAIVVAMTISSIPAVCEAWCQTNNMGWWYWVGISFCGFLATYGASEWTVKDRLFPVTSLVFCSCMVMIILL